MMDEKKYNHPLKVADGIFWVGFRDEKTNFTCNPYLVIENGQAVLIDGGSRSDFAEVMLKILQTGIDPGQITGLIYQHYDPDLCGSMTNFLDMCDHPDLRIISDDRNNTFISYYIHRDRHTLMSSIGDYRHSLSLNGRMLRFLPTPYSHSAGSFVTFDEKTGTLFSSDLFGSFAPESELFTTLNPDCYTCCTYDACPNHRYYCPVEGILNFHKTVMPSTKALRYALRQISTVPVKCIAPQHGSILKQPEDIAFVIQKLENLENVGIDGYDYD
jgi:flavorubredoxin